MNEVQEINDFGAARKFILDSLILIRDGKIPPKTVNTMINGLKVVNENVQVEVNVAKVSLLYAEKGKEFTKIVEMGKTSIGAK